MKAENLSREQMVQTIEFLMARIDGTTRGKLMANLPQAYNAYHGREIVRVVSADTGDTVIFTETVLAENGHFEQVVPAMLGTA